MAKCRHGSIESECGLCSPVSMAQFEEEKQKWFQMYENQLKNAQDKIQELEQEVLDLSEGIATDPTWQLIVLENRQLKKDLENIREMDDRAFRAWQQERERLHKVADDARLDATKWRIATEEAESIVEVAHECFLSNADPLVKWNKLINLLRKTQEEE